MKKTYESPIIDIEEFDVENILTDSLGSMPGDHNTGYGDIWDTEE